MMSRRPQPAPPPPYALFAALLGVLWVLGCSQPDAPTPDAAPDVKRIDVAVEDAALDVAVDARDATVAPDVARPDVPVDRVDAAVDRATDVPRELTFADLGPFVPDDDVPAGYDVNFDRSWDVPRPDVTLQWLDVASLLRDAGPPDSPFPPCVEGSVETCACTDGRPGFQTCEYDQSWTACGCADPPPTISTPRLVAPLSGMRVTSQRPTLRWRLPASVTRARVELCADRPCTRMLAQHEVTGETWRSATPLTPGLVFWRVRGLDAAGAVAWTSATWLFQVRRRDTPIDSTMGRFVDFNGDGYDDLSLMRSVTPEPLYGAAVDVFFGTPDGLSPEPQLSIQLPEEELALGRRILGRTVSDTNGDGYSDLVINVYYPDRFSLPDLASSDIFYVYQGAPHQPLARRTARLNVPNEGSASFPTSPDLDGDGVSEFVTNGWAVFRGTAVGSSFTPAYYEQSNYAPSPRDASFWWVPAVDINRDGFPDAFRFRQGREADQVSFGVGTLEFDRQARPMDTPPAAYRSTFASLSTGDVNGDGYADLLRVNGVQIRPSNDLRYLTVFFGGVRPLYRDTPRMLPLPSGHTGMAHATGRTGDINGDGFADVIVGYYDEVDRRHRVALYLGSSAGLARTPASILGDFSSSSIEYGLQASLLGDFNGDGYDDICVSHSETDSRDHVLIFHGGDARQSMPARHYAQRFIGFYFMSTLN